MAGCVGILGTECGTEGVNLLECECIGLDIELSGYGKVCCLSEEILGIIDFSVLGQGKVVEIEGGNLEHLTRALAIASGNDGAVHINEALLLEEAVDRKRDDGSYPEHCLEGVGAGSEMGHGAQILEGMALFLERIVGRRDSLDTYLLSLHLKRLLCIGSGYDLTPCNDGGSDAEMSDLIEVGKSVAVNYLESPEIGSVTQCDEAEALGIPV